MFNLARVDLPLLAAGLVVWAVVLLLVWLVHRQPPASERELDFLKWKSVHKRPTASFAEFVGSEQAPRAYISGTNLSLGLTAFALLVLYGALRGWGAIN